MKENHKILIDPKEFQSLVLDYIGSEEFNKMIDATVFTGEPAYRSAIVHGMTIASMLTCRCTKFELIERIKETDIYVITDEYDIILGLTDLGKQQKELVIPSKIDDVSISIIGEMVFARCESLTSVSISEGITKIGVWAFSNCRYLKSITIPNSIKEICAGAFHGCNSLATVNYTGTEEQWNSIDICQCNSALLDATINFNYKY